MKKLIADARAFAYIKHAGHVRKYTGDPYTTHLERVAAMVATYGGDADMVAAAFLHDTVEDTDTTLPEIRDAFGVRVAELVSYLTDGSPHSAGNRAVRKGLYQDQLARAPADAQTVKLADLIDNAKDIATNATKGFAKLWLKEKRAMLPVLTKGDAALLKRAWATLAKAEADLKAAA